MAMDSKRSVHFIVSDTEQTVSLTAVKRKDEMTSG